MLNVQGPLAAPIHRNTILSNQGAASGKVETQSVYVLGHSKFSSRWFCRDELLCPAWAPKAVAVAGANIQPTNQLLEYRRHVGAVSSCTRRWCTFNRTGREVASHHLSPPIAAPPTSPQSPDRSVTYITSDHRSQRHLHHLRLPIAAPPTSHGGYLAEHVAARGQLIGRPG